MTIYGIDRFNGRNGLAAENVRKLANDPPANDNLPIEKLVGLGNRLWAPPPIDVMNSAEVDIGAKPLRILHEMIVQALACIADDEDDTLNEGAVYVVGDVMASVVKIGKAIDPVLRLAQLQTGHPNRLFLHRVFWMDKKAADIIELSAHERAALRYRRLQGEWFACTPNEAHEAIEDAIFDERCLDTYCAMTPLTVHRGAA